MRTAVLVRSSSRSLIGLVWSSARARKGAALGILVGGSMHAVGHAGLAGAGGLLASSLAGGKSPMDARSIQGALAAIGGGDALICLALVGAFAAIVKLVGGVLASSSEGRLAGDVGARLRLQVLGGVLALNRLQHPRHDDHGGRGLAHPATPPPTVSDSASKLEALTVRVAEVERAVSHGLLVELRALAQLAPLAWLLWVLAPSLAFGAALVMGAFGLFTFAVRRAFKRAHADALALSGRLFAAADEAVRHAELWTTYGAERTIKDHVARLGERMARQAASLRARSALLSGTSEVLGALALVVALVLVTRGAVVGVDHGKLVPFAVAFFMAYRPLRDLVEARLARARGEAACSEVDAGEDDEGGPSAARPVAAAFDADVLELDGLVGAHGRHAPLTLRVRPGEIVALVGPSGVGKTQLLRVLLGLERAREGQVRYASSSLEGAPVGPAARPFAWVPQDAPALAATARANVALAARSEADVASAIDAAGLRRLVASSGERLLVSERPLSGGERQRLSIARALATGLPVLLLDEPSSALDDEAERALLEVLAALRGARTVLLVTHRPGPLAIADRVIRLREVDDAERGASGDADLVAAQ